MTGAIETAPDVFYTPGETIVAGPAEIAFLKAHAAASVRKRSRLCMHPASTAALHEMLIVHARSVYVRPHAHRTRPESFHVIEGAAQAILFDDDGNVRSTVDLGDANGGAAFYYRIPERTYHMLVIRSEWLVFHETTLGPFDPADTTFPPWAPDGTNAAAAQAFVERIARETPAR